MSRPWIHWHVGGHGDTALLLVNGWSASGLVWPRQWLAQLEERYCVIRPDNRGSGWSRSAPRPFTVATMADDAKDVLLATGFSRASVLGLSMGGMISQEIVLRHPDVVDNLVLVGTRPPVPAGTDVDPALFLSSMRGPRSGQGLDEFFHTMWSSFAAPGFAGAHPELMAEMVAQIRRRPMRRSAVLDQMRAMSAWCGAHRLRRIVAPTTVVHGQQDPLIGIENGRRLAQCIPGAELVELPGVGHLVPYEAGEVLIEILDRCDDGRVPTTP